MTSVSVNPATMASTAKSCATVSVTAQSTALARAALTAEGVTSVTSPAARV